MPQPAFTVRSPSTDTNGGPVSPVRLYNADSYEIGQPLVQNFTAGGVAATQMSHTTSFGERHRFTSLTTKFNTPVTATLQISLISALNGSYNTVLLTTGITSNTDLFWQPDSDLIQSSGDEVRITSTGLASGNTWYVRAVGEAR